MLSKLESKTFQIHLKGEGLSGRGVRFKLLKPSEKRKSDLLASELLDKEANNLQFFMQRLAEGVKSFIVAVTEQHSLENVFDPSVVWRSVTYADLSTPGSDFEIESGDLFTSGDLELLEKFYAQYHEPSAQTIKTVMGEAKPVA